MSSLRRGVLITPRHLLVAAVLFAGFFGVRSAAQTMCTAPMGWPSLLTYFCADAPARADEVNGNFRQLVTWLEAKVGPVGQPYVVVVPSNAVSSANIVDGGVTSTDLAPGAVDTTALANDSVTAAKVVGRVAVYSYSTQCTASGDLTLNTTCVYSSARCRTNCSASIDGYELCDGSCPACLSNPAPRQCVANNTLRGYLVGP